MFRNNLLALSFAGFLAACSSAATTTGTVNVAALTPREVLYGIEASYTAAANTANQIAPSLTAAQKAALIPAYTAAGNALNAADAAVEAGTADSNTALAAAQTALTALTAILQQYGVK